MWSFFCHCVIEALLGDFFFLLSHSLSLSPLSSFKKGSVIVKCCKGSGRGKGEVGGVLQGVEEFLYEGGGQVDGNKKKNVFR